MNRGKEKRLKRILPDGRTVMVPMDHGASMGPIKGLTNMQEIINKLQAGGADAVVIHRGIAKHVDTGTVGLIIHLSASTSLSPDPNWKVTACSVEEALRLGADGISVHVNVGASKEAEMLKELGSVADECDRFGIPLLAMMYPRGPNIKSEHELEVVAHAARLGAELGADIIKTNYTGSPETFRQVVESTPVPVIIAGGPRVKSDIEFLKMVYDSVKAGGVGVSIGRNVFQHERPAAMVKALSSIVHRGGTVEEAAKILGGN